MTPASGVQPPTIRLQVSRLDKSLPGITRSGQQHTRNSVVAERPEVRSRVGTTSPDIVPGGIVDSTMTSVPGRKWAPAVAEAFCRATRSGVLDSGATGV